MITSRRSLFTILAGGIAAAAAGKVEARPVWHSKGDPTPRPSHYSSPEHNNFDHVISSFRNAQQCGLIR